MWSTNADHTPFDMKEKIIIQSGYSGRERLPFINNSRYEIKFLEKTSPENKSIPHVGSLEFCQKATGVLRPDFLPKWSEKLWGRRVNRLRYCSSVVGECHVKNASTYKGGSKINDGGEIWEDSLVSEMVNIKNEYRHYFLNGMELCSWWYDGKDELHSGTQPNGFEIKCDIPKDLCGTLDMAELEDGDYVLIESHIHPVAIGWYGEDNLDYERFLVEGWGSVFSC